MIGALAALLIDGGGEMIARGFLEKSDLGLKVEHLSFGAHARPRSRIRRGIYDRCFLVGKARASVAAWRKTVSFQTFRLITRWAAIYQWKISRNLPAPSPDTT